MKRIGLFSLFMSFIVLVAACSEEMVKVDVPEGLVLTGGMTFEEFQKQVVEEEKRDQVSQEKEGYVTYTLPKKERDEQLANMRHEIEEYSNALAVDPAFPSIERVTMNEAIDEFEVHVDRKAYEKSMDSLVTISLSMSSMFYQTFSGIEQPEVTFIIKDEATGETIDTLTFPE